MRDGRHRRGAVWFMVMGTSAFVLGALVLRGVSARAATTPVPIETRRAG